MMILLAVSVFAGAGTIHYQTPMLGAFAAEFNVDAAAAGWVATLTFGGFLTGTIFLVPLGDRFDKRRLILGELALLIVALLAMAAAPSLAPSLMATRPTLAAAALRDTGSGYTQPILTQNAAAPKTEPPRSELRPESTPESVPAAAAAAESAALRNGAFVAPRPVEAAPARPVPIAQPTMTDSIEREAAS